MDASPLFDSRVFNHKPHDFLHRNAVDIVAGQRLGLVRRFYLRFRDDEDGTIIPFVTIRFLAGEGEEHEIPYEEDEVGFLDIGMPVTADELLGHLNGLQKDLNYYERLLGRNHQDTIDMRLEYDSLISDVRAIMCANNFFDLHLYESIMARHYLMGLG